MSADKKYLLSNQLKKSWIVAALVLVVSACSLVMVTYAWYVYQTSARTSNIHMAVGSGSSLQISNKYDEGYGTSTIMDEFDGFLNPVSTDKIQNGFQKVIGFTNGSENQPRLLANLFGASDGTDYYKTTLYVRLSGEEQKVYLSDIGYEDNDSDNPISTAIRMGFVIHEPGKNKPTTGEYIFAINTADNPKAEYNTFTGQEGYVLDSTKTDGTTIPMTKLYTEANFCEYNNETGAVTLKSQSTPMFTLKGDGKGGYGDPVQVDIYVWLEGCDKDCTNNLCSTMLSKVALSFAGKSDTAKGGQ